MMASAFVSSCLLGSASRLAPVSLFALRRDLRLVQPLTCAVGDRSGVGGLASPHPILVASGARHSSGAALGVVACARVVLRHVPMVLETVQVQFTAPVVEPTVMSFTVPWDVCTIVATTIVVTSCSSSASVLRECLRRDVVWWWIFHFWWCLRFGLGQREAYDWKLHYLFPFLRERWVCLRAECLVQQQRRDLR